MSIYNGGKFFRNKAGSADKTAVDFAHIEQTFGIFVVHASAVLNVQFFGSLFAVHVGKNTSYKGDGVICLFVGGGNACAYCPNRFVSHYDVGKFFFRYVLEAFPHDVAVPFPCCRCCVLPKFRQCTRWV